MNQTVSRNTQQRSEDRVLVPSLSFNMLVGKEDNAVLNRLSTDMREVFNSGNPDSDNVELIRKFLIRTINCCSFDNFPNTYKSTFQKEHFYASIFVLALVFANLDPKPEISSAEGRIDIGFAFPENHSWILELKHSIDDTGIEARALEAREQLKKKLYRNAYLARYCTVTELIIVIAGRQNVHVVLNGHFLPDDISG
jgi:hypothetical protein